MKSEKFMRREWLKILLVFLLVFGFACSKSDDSEDSGLLDFTNDTDKAVELVNDANNDLKTIKKLYKANFNKIEDFKIAMRDKKPEEAKKIADDLVYVINDGAGAGKKAIEKLEAAQELNINENFKTYLGLKEQSLSKLLDAFEFQRQVARSLRDGYDPNDKGQREKLIVEFTESQENFKKIMAVAQEYSDKANELAKQSKQEESEK